MNHILKKINIKKLGNVTKIFFLKFVINSEKMIMEQDLLIILMFLI